MYMYSTDQLLGISLLCAKRKRSQSEQVRHTLTMNAVSRLNVFDRSYACKRKTIMCGCETRCAMHNCARWVGVIKRSEELTSSIAQWQDWTTGLGCGYLFSYGCLYAGSPCAQVKWVLIFMGCLFLYGCLLSWVYGISRHPWALTQYSNKVYSAVSAVAWLVLPVVHNFSLS